MLKSVKLMLYWFCGQLFFISFRPKFDDKEFLSEKMLGKKLVQQKSITFLSADNDFKRLFAFRTAKYHHKKEEDCVCLDLILDSRIDFLDLYLHRFLASGKRVSWSRLSCGHHVISSI